MWEDSGVLLPSATVLIVTLPHDQDPEGQFWRFAPFYDHSDRYSRYHMTMTLVGRLLKVH